MDQRISPAPTPSGDDRPESPSRLLRGAASRIACAPATAADADLKIPRAHYDPLPGLDALTEQGTGKRRQWYHPAGADALGVTRWHGPGGASAGAS
ncbi:hypothetical protein ABZT48_38915 [Streptomyces avermitilis]|uniref:hypothetical protein n=2 Tax=Streptomyces avermitilis TaxID=33903 RepID=UPI0033B5F5BB